MRNVLALGSLLSFVTLAWTPSQQGVRDVRPEPKGTAMISGVVLSEGAGGKPQRRAVVSLSGAPLQTAQLVSTDDEGRFVLPDLPAGQFTLTARKSAYMTTTYGAVRPGGTGSPIVVRDGQQLTGIRLVLTRWGSISGTVYDQNGEPVQNMSVEVLRYTMRTGRRTLSNVYGRPAFTDDRGVYVAGGLVAGDYYVAAGPSPDLGVMDLVQLSASDIDRALQGPAGSSGSVTAAAPGGPRQRVTFAPVFFPGVTDLANASQVTLKMSEDRAGVDIRLQLVPSARIDVTVTGPGGEPAAGAQVVATKITQAYSMDLFMAGALGAAQSNGQGGFSYSAVSPGQYVITARTRAVAASANGPAAGPLWAMSEVIVNGVDQSVALSLQPGMSVSGTVVFDGTTLQPPAGMANIRLGLTPATGDSGVAMGITAVSAAANGSFRFTGAAPGPYLVSAQAPPAPPGWLPRSAMVGGVDALDLPFEVKPNQDVDGVVVTYTDHPTELSGSLQAASGTPTSDYFIIVFATNRSYWTPFSRRSVSVRPATTGRYLVRNLPPGEYHIAAVTDVEQGHWYDPAFLEKLIPASTRVTLGEGEKRTLDLKLAGGS